ncbi:MAG: caspase domain-containing protein, partial [Saprospiraceae bacterium]
MSKTTLHALIVGIDAYDPYITVGGKACFHPLQGCVRDAKALRDWLVADPGFELNGIALYNHQATKANIARHFREHLSKAEPGDSVLFFYSGHGTMESADKEVWAEETDGTIEGLACYYDRTNSADFILADKELRYLLHSISKPGVHVAALFDCCHSGDNTRAAMGEDVVRKQGEGVFPQRPWEHFLFAEKHPRASVLGKKTRDFLPEGNYVALAAAESDQSAIETTIGPERHGVFAFHLLEMLRQSGGNISYRDLTNQIRNRIRFKYGQRTKVFASRADLYEEGFLQKKLPDPSTGLGTVTYNTFTNQYRIDRGILARVMPNVTRIQAQTPDGRSLRGRIGSADLNSADVIFEPADLTAFAKPIERMAAEMDRLAGKPLRIYFWNKDLTDAEALSLTTFLFSTENQAFVVQESDQANADYILFAWAGMYYLTEKEELFKPVVLPIKIDDEAAGDAPVSAETKRETPLETLLRYLKQMAVWHFFKDMNNPGVDAIPQDFLQIDITDVRERGVQPASTITDMRGNRLEVQDGVLTCSLPPTGQLDPFNRPTYETDIKIRLTNRSTKNLYVAALWFSDFGVYASAITNPDSTRAIPPGGSEDFEMFGSNTVTLVLDGTTRLFRKPYGSSEMKFLFSTDPFESKMLDEESLPTPDLMATRKNFKTPASSDESRTLPASGWNTRNIEIRTLNPEYEIPDLTDLKNSLDEKLGDPDLAHFLSGIYLQKKAGMSAGLEQRGEVDILEKGGFFWDSILTGANYWSNFRRNRHYAKMARKNPHLPKIVSEGDSWFQHPMLDDVIDNVGRFYPTYCLAAAGDTIRNYFAKNEIAGAVKKVRPTVLLLSGGGNDILGESLPSFLAEQFADALEG